MRFKDEPVDVCLYDLMTFAREAKAYASKWGSEHSFSENATPEQCEYFTIDKTLTDPAISVMTQRTDASLLTDMSLFIGDMDDFISAHPEARQNISQDPNGVFLANRIKAIADSASHLSSKARKALPSQPMRWVAETAEITSRHDMWHKIDQKGYRRFIGEGMKLCREAVDKTLAELQRT